MITELIPAVGALVLLYVSHEAGRSKGYMEGVKDASGWRDELIEKYRAMVIEALSQRDKARAARTVLPPLPSPLASKDWN